ncbi:hypothetical protein MPSEU_000342800 [Mayamaea pseudoterrestris]|nr:hypothetical protein MPSEU_000342800 [Mayamaea pseudoterrestris]
MNFHWNLSSDSEEEVELDEWVHQQGQFSAAAPAASCAGDEKPFAATHAASYNADSGFNDFEDEDDDEDNVGWEDGGDQPTTPALRESYADDDDRKMPADASLLRPVTINMHQQDEEPAAKKRKRNKTRKCFRIESLPQHMQSLLRDLHQTNLLACASRACYLSNICSDDDVLAIAHSLLPPCWIVTSIVTPSVSQVKRLVGWFHDRIHHVMEVRRRRMRENAARGTTTRATRQQRQSKRRTLKVTPDLELVDGGEETSLRKLLDYCHFLSHTLDDNAADGLMVHQWNESDQTLLFLAMVRSLGWRARLVMNIDPIKQDLDVDHPLMSQSRNIFSSVRRLTSKSPTSVMETDSIISPAPSLMWVEISCRELVVKGKAKQRWVHVDSVRALVDRPGHVETLLFSQLGTLGRTSNPKRPVAFVLAVEHQSTDHMTLPFRLTDVTPRYADSWVASLRERGAIRDKKSMVESKWKDSWWSRTLHILNHGTETVIPSSSPLGLKYEEPFLVDSSDDDRKLPAISQTSRFFGEDDNEAEELETSANDELIPSSKAAFQTHPVFVLASLLGKAEVLTPDAKDRIKGVFKGELVYSRSDVSTARTARKWLYEGRKVMDAELVKPIKRVKARKKPVAKEFKPLRSYGVGKGNDGSEEQRALDLARAEKPLEDGVEDLYAIWQTTRWSPPAVGPDDQIPYNKFGNIELALLNPGLVHVDVGDAAAVAKRLQIPYAPCLLGFEGHGGNRTPSIRGIVVHAHNEELIREGSIELTNHAFVEGEETRQRNVLKRWKSLMHALLVKDRLEREYS